MFFFGRKAEGRSREGEEDCRGTAASAANDQGRDIIINVYEEARANPHLVSGYLFFLSSVDS